MIKRMLVPLDGSELAEEALIIAGELAESLDGTIILLRVVAPPVPGRFYAPHFLDQLQEAQVREAEAYLDSVAERLQKDHLNIDTYVLSGEVADLLVKFTEVERCDLIVMGSHGLSGTGWSVFGSVAQKVLHSSHCPVLIVRPTSSGWEREEESEEKQADETLLSGLAQSSVPQQS